MLYLLIVFLPAICGLCALLLGRPLGHRGAALITCGGLITTALISTVAFYEVVLNESPCSIKLAPWIDTELLQVSWGFLYDTLTATILIVVTYVSSLVHLYSTEYIRGDPHLPRFISYLSFFTFFILILVTADNFVQLFLGWEGVGLCSYLLISFWYTRVQANKAAVKAFVVNRVGDFGFALGIWAVFLLFRSVDFCTVFSAVPFIEAEIQVFGYSWDALTIVGLLLFVGSVGKSAQLGLHTWLPDAIEGPTPVSALIHAATIVTAGVFLIIRCSPLYEFAPIALLVITFIGAITAFFAATTGILQNDLKKVIAYSTCSQLGYITFACGCSQYTVGAFHLANHAFFKALLFLGAGSIIHAIADEQDIRHIGGLRDTLTYTYTCIWIGSLSLIGFPLLTGFESKDVILEVACGSFTFQGTFAHWLGTIAAFFTAFYSFRLLYLTFCNDPNGNRPFFEQSHDSPILIAGPLFLLSIGSCCVGYLTRDWAIGIGTNAWGLAVLSVSSTGVDAEFLPYAWKILPVVISICGATLSLLLYNSFIKALVRLNLGPLLSNSFTPSGSSFLGIQLYRFLNKKWFFDKVYNDTLVPATIRFGYHTTFLTIDKGVIEILGPQGIVIILQKVVRSARYIQTGYLYHYASIILGGVIFLLSFPLFSASTVPILVLVGWGLIVVSG